MIKLLLIYLDRYTIKYLIFAFRLTNIKDNMNVSYNIKHLFHLVLNYCFSDISPLTNVFTKHLNLSPLCKSSLSYLLSKVYSFDYVYSFYNISKKIPKTYFIRSDDTEKYY